MEKTISTAKKNNSSSKNQSWVSRISFYLLAIGSACSLGNIWRFPYVVGENGGGAFLLLYIFLALTVGVSILIAELILGRSVKSSLLKISNQVHTDSKSNYSWIGKLSILIIVVMLAYYSVISGWVLYYMTQFSVAIFNTPDPANLALIQFDPLKKSGLLQFALASVHLIICGFIVSKNFIEKFERIFIKLLPVLALLFIILIYRAFSLESRQDVLRFLFYPDFSKLNISSLGRALGHVFFTLSVGMGILVTYGSYFKDDEHLPSVGIRVASIDTIISILALLIVFPIAFTLGTKNQLMDPFLLFESLPYLIARVRYGDFFGLIFFLCLWLAALNASLGLAETLIANMRDKFPKLSRPMAVGIIFSFVLFITLVPAFSGTTFSKLRFLNQSFMENLDSLLINYFLPISALGLIFLFFNSISEHDIKNRFIDLTGKNSQSMYVHWIWVLKWMAPFLIILALVLQFFGIIRSLI